VFALEILHRRGLEYYEALLPAMIGALSGYAVNLVASGSGLTPVWSFPPLGAVKGVDLLWGLACGVAGAGVAVAFTFLARGMQWVLGRAGPGVRPVIGGVALGLLAFWSPYALTFGEAQISGLLAAKVATTTLFVAVAAKLCGTTVTLASGWRGGFIIPLFFMGVALGQGAHALLPHTNVVVLMAALMAATNCGVTKTPIGSALVVAEMAGLRLLPPVLLASIVALLLTSQVGLIHSQRERVA
jgi:H+/Cl- antiporter ClcA